MATVEATAQHTSVTVASAVPDDDALVILPPQPTSHLSPEDSFSLHRPPPTTAASNEESDTFVSISLDETTDSIPSVSSAPHTQLPAAPHVETDGITPQLPEHRRTSRRLQEKTTQLMTNGANTHGLKRESAARHVLSASVKEPHEAILDVVLPDAMIDTEEDTAALPPDILANILFAYNLRVALNPPEDRQIPGNPFSLFGVGEKGSKRVGIWKKTPDMYSLLGLQAAPDPFVRRCRYVGLRNLGATCYMNSYLQTLYMNPDFRYKLFAVQPSSLPGLSDTENPEAQLDVVGELQQLFTSLQSGTCQAADPSGVARALRISTDYQEDATEFATLLLMTLERQLGGSKSLHNFVPELFRGHQTQRMTCGACGNVSTRTDDFYELRVQVPPPTVSPSFKSPDTTSVKWRQKRKAKPSTTHSSSIPATTRDTLGSSADVAGGISMESASAEDSTTVSNHLSVPSDELPTVPLDETGSDVDIDDSSGLQEAQQVDREEKRDTGVSEGCSPRGKAFHLESGLARVFQSEQLRGDNRYMCNVCGEKVDAERRIFLAALPPYLHICFERYAYDGSGRKKLTTLVDYPLTLNLKKFREPIDFKKPAAGNTASSPAAAQQDDHLSVQSDVDAREDQPDENRSDEYELIGILEHQGSSALAGHYVAHLRDLDEPTDHPSARRGGGPGTSTVSATASELTKTEGGKHAKKHSPKLVPSRVRKSSKSLTSKAGAAVDDVVEKSSQFSSYSVAVTQDAREAGAGRSDHADQGREAKQAALLPCDCPHMARVSAGNAVLNSEPSADGKSRQKRSVASTGIGTKRTSAKSKQLLGTTLLDEKKRRIRDSSQSGADDGLLCVDAGQTGDRGQVVASSRSVASLSAAAKEEGGKASTTLATEALSITKLETSDDSYGTVISFGSSGSSLAAAIPSAPGSPCLSAEVSTIPCGSVPAGAAHAPSGTFSPANDLLNGHLQPRKKPRYHPNHPKIVEAPGAHRTISHKGRSHNIQSSLINGGGAPLSTSIPANPCLSSPVFSPPFWPGSPLRGNPFPPPPIPEFLMFHPPPLGSMPAASSPSLQPSEFPDFSSFYFLRAATAAAAAASSQFGLFPPVLGFPPPMRSLSPGSSGPPVSPPFNLFGRSTPPVASPHLAASVSAANKPNGCPSGGNTALLPPSVFAADSTPFGLPPVSPAAFFGHSYPLPTGIAAGGGPAGQASFPTTVITPSEGEKSAVFPLQRAASSHNSQRDIGSPPIVSSQAPTEGATAALVTSSSTSSSSGEVLPAASYPLSSSTSVSSASSVLPETVVSNHIVATPVTSQVFPSAGPLSPPPPLLSSSPTGVQEQKCSSGPSGSPVSPQELCPSSCRSRDPLASPSRTKIVGWVTTARPSSSDCFIPSDGSPKHGEAILRDDDHCRASNDCSAFPSTTELSATIVNNTIVQQQQPQPQQHNTPPAPLASAVQPPPIGHYHSDIPNGQVTWRAPREGLLGGQKLVNECVVDPQPRDSVDSSVSPCAGYDEPVVDANTPPELSTATTYGPCSHFSDRSDLAEGSRITDALTTEASYVSDLSSSLKLETEHISPTTTESPVLSAVPVTRSLRTRHHRTTPDSISLSPAATTLTAHSGPKRSKRYETGNSECGASADQKWSWIQFDDATVSEWKVQNHYFTHRSSDPDIPNGVPGWNGKPEKNRLSSRSAYLVIYKRKNWKPTTLTASSPPDSSTGGVTPTVMGSPPKLEPVAPVSGSHQHGSSLNHALESFVARRRSEVLGHVRDAIQTLQEHYKNWKSKYYTVSNEWFLFRYCLSSMVFVPMSWWTAFICGNDFASLSMCLPPELRPVRAAGNPNAATWCRPVFSRESRTTRKGGSASTLRTTSNSSSTLQSAVRQDEDMRYEVVLYEEILCPHYIRAIETGSCSTGHHWGAPSAKKEEAEPGSPCKKQSTTSDVSTKHFGSAGYGVDPLAVWNGKAKLVPSSVIREIFETYHIAASIPRIQFMDLVCMDCSNGFSQLVEYWFEQRTLLNDMCRFVRSYSDIQLVPSAEAAENKTPPGTSSTTSSGATRRGHFFSLSGAAAPGRRSTLETLPEAGEPLCWVSRRVLMDVDARFSARDKTRKLPEGIYTLYNAADDARRELHRFREAAHKHKHQSPPTTESPRDDAISDNSSTNYSNQQHDLTASRESESASSGASGERQAVWPPCLNVTADGSDNKQDTQSKTLPDDSANGRATALHVKHDFASGIVCSHGKLDPDKKAGSRVLVPKAKLERFLKVEDLRLELLVTQFLLDFNVTDKSRATMSAWIECTGWDLDPAPSTGTTQRAPTLLVPPCGELNCSICELMLVQERQRMADWKIKVEAEKAAVGECVYKRVCKLTKLHDARRYAPYCLAEGRHYLLPTEWLSMYFAYLSAKDEESAVLPGPIDGRVILTQCTCLDNDNGNQASEPHALLAYDPVSYLDSLQGITLHPKENAKHPESDIYILTHETEFEPLAQRYGSIDVPYITVALQPSSPTKGAHHSPSIRESRDALTSSAASGDTAAAGDSSRVPSSSGVTVTYTYSIKPCLSCVQTRRFAPGGVGDFTSVTLRLHVESIKVALGRQTSRRQLFTVSGDTRISHLVEQVASALNLPSDAIVTGKVQLWLEGSVTTPFYDRRTLERSVSAASQDKVQAVSSLSFGARPWSGGASTSLTTHRSTNGSSLWCRLPLTLSGSPATLRDYRTKIDSRWCIHVVDGEQVAVPDS